MCTMIGCQAHLRCLRQQGKQWKLYVDPDDSWQAQTGAYVIEDMDSDYVMLREQKTGKPKFLAREDLVIVGYSQKRKT